MTIRFLTAEDASAFQELRLSALIESPTAFSSSYEEECDAPMALITARLTPADDHSVFGAFQGCELVGMIGIFRERQHKLTHKAIVWGMYVAPSHRSKGFGRGLLTEALRFAGSIAGVRQVKLSVNASNDVAIALYENLGFMEFGIERGCMLVEGQLQDERHMVRSIDGGT